MYPSKKRKQPWIVSKQRRWCRRLLTLEACPLPRTKRRSQPSLLTPRSISSLRICEASSGVQIPVARFEGKRKISQNRPEIDRVGVMAGLAASENPQDREVATFIQPAGAHSRRP
jgi:predicted FMN-binding regulatory protein PaiB